MSQVWSHGLFGCFSDITTCLITWIIPCYTAGKNAESVGESCLAHGVYTLLPLIGWYCHATVRGKIREKKGIDGTFFNDLLLSVFCELCALVQEAQEVNQAPPPLAMSRE
ncbi:uncharacterized protein [Dysidea avara]|uniref:uncharacterized protein n=1 Tax=Dysidea avara TaxID=196820 RepID=UPI0033341628